MDWGTAAAILMVQGAVLLLLHTTDARVEWYAVMTLANMICIVVYAPRILEFAGWHSNVGNFYYAGAIASQMCILARWGVKVAWDRVGYVLGIFGLFLVLGQLAWVDDPNTEFGHALFKLRYISPTVMLGSFLAFFVAMVTMVWCQKIGIWGVKLPIAVVLIQVVDSLVFFPIAFGPHAIREAGVFEATLTGFVLKVLAGWLLVPIVIISGKVKAE